MVAVSQGQIKGGIMIPIFGGIVKGGKLKFDTPEQFLVYLSGFENKRFQLSLQREKNARTLSQNRYYWGVIIEILSDVFGYDKEEMHEALKFKFLKKYGDTDLVTVGSTAKLSIAGFADYIDEIIRWASVEYQIVIPDADGGDIEL